MQSTKKPTVRYSGLMFAALKEIADGRMTTSSASAVKDTTLYWIFYHGWAKQQGDYLLLTPAGLDALEGYTETPVPLRKRPRPFTARTSEYMSARALRRVS